MAKKKPRRETPARPRDEYGVLVSGISELLDRARRSSARLINTILAATYYEIGRRVVEHEQGGKERAEYGGALLRRLSEDLTRSHGRGFSERNLRQMRAFYLGWEIRQTPSARLQARVKIGRRGQEPPRKGLLLSPRSSPPGCRRGLASRTSSLSPGPRADLTFRDTRPDSPSPGVPAPAR
jgi:hypothetical protein